jgi:NAD(P)-dependent dehydrogenase (short-subunit alcohol dehydrogenase family)
LTSTMKAVHEKFGSLQILINNARIYPHIPFEEVTFEAWRQIHSVNLDSVFLCSQAAFPFMKQASYGRIVNLASSVVFIDLKGLTAYAASKAGLIGFTRVLASEGGEHGSTANVVAPGLVESEGVLEDIEDLFDVVVPQQVVKRRGQPADIAECIAYLVSSEAGFITGQTVNVDGGHRFH